MNNYYICIFVLTCHMCNFAIGIQHCRSHRFEQSLNSSDMQFTKEAVTMEYGLFNQFKSLHCCAKSYRSLEWYKNGKPYPWAGEESSLILYPEDENQTIYTRSSTVWDSGTYTCVLRNNTHTLQHHMEFKVEVNIPDKPLPTYIPHNQIIELGASGRTYCEGFVGNVNLPDAKNNILWYKVDSKKNLIEVPKNYQQITPREDGQILGALLIIHEFKNEHYGQYICRIEIGNELHRLDMTVKFSAISSLATTATFIRHIGWIWIICLCIISCASVAIIMLWYCKRRQKKCFIDASMKKDDDTTNIVIPYVDGDCNKYYNKLISEYLWQISQLEYYNNAA